MSETSTATRRSAQHWLRYAEGFLIALACLAFLPGIAGRISADSPTSDLQGANAVVQRALTAAQSGDVTTARQQYEAFKASWPSMEDGIRAINRDQYRAIEARMRDVDAALVPAPPDQTQLVSTLTGLDQAQKTFLQGQGVASAPAPAAAPAAPAVAEPSGPATIDTLLQDLNRARTAQAAGKYSEALAQVKAFENTWPDVEGTVKTRSATAYNQTEDDMGLVAGLLGEQSPQSKAVLDRMYNRLEPFTQTAHYGVFDAAIILLREGLEALLVLVALLAVLKRSGNAARQGWIWSGAALGLFLSIALGVALHLLLKSVMNAGNRELIEGFTGLIAAGMLLYVSYWLHSKTSLKGWQQQIRERTSSALTTGSLLGLAFLSFLAIFREGAETVLFFLGMAADISTRDLLVGLGAGTLGLVILGTLIMVIGVRIPMRPFFAVASVLVFYLCFKFLGTGIQALQVAGRLPESGSNYLPTSDFFGISPTWQTAIPQLLLLVLAIGVLVQGWLKQHSPGGRASTAAIAQK